MVGQRCIHFTFMPMGMRVLFTSTLVVLGVGYLFAMIHIFASHAGRDGNPALSVDDLIIAYSGSQSDTRLEAALKGPMSKMLPPEEMNEVIAWVRRGAEEKEFTGQRIEKIIEKRCISCHSGKNPHIPNLSNFEGISEVVEKDTGMDIFTLVRVSHIHLFGLTFIFFIVSSIFCHSYIRPNWLKCVIIMIPFFAILADIASWYLTKVFSPFAWVVMGSGALMGTAFGIQWVVSIYQMWFYKLPKNIVDDGGVVS
ncbi:hypothetical protein [Kaarinaea lacus]